MKEKAQSYGKTSKNSTIKERVWNLLRSDPTLTAKPICQRLNLDYKKHESYVARLKSEWKSYSQYGLPLKSQALHKRVFVWDNVVRSDERVAVALKCGWIKSSNRNAMMRFYNSLGTVHWYRNGRVMLYLHGRGHLGAVKGLFAKAFQVLTDEELHGFLEIEPRGTDRHWVFETGERLPRFHIDQFKKPYGIDIYSDSSHPTAIEASESIPFWMVKLEGTLDLFGQDIKEHLALIEAWRRESEVCRRQREYQSDSWFQRLCNYMAKEVTFPNYKKLKSKETTNVFRQSWNLLTLTTRNVVSQWA